MDEKFFVYLLILYLLQCIASEFGTLILAGQKPIRRSKQGHFQIIDVVEMMHPITKYTKQIVSGWNVPSMVRESFRLACEERPGACHLELPEDIAREMVDASPFTVQ